MKNKRSIMIILISLILLLILGHFRALKIERSINDVKHQNGKVIAKIEAIEGHVADDSIAGKIPVPYKKYAGKFMATFYCDCPKCVGKKAVVKTASGNIPIAEKTIAVDTSIIPLHSIVYIKGMGFYVAEDTGGNIKGKRIDIFVHSHEQALKMGKKQVEIYIL